MINLDRLPEPEILSQKKDIWLSRFIASGKDRPYSSQYAHGDIKRDLSSISHSKCYYCETKLEDEEKQVDHYIEVSIENELAFEWDNLYLSCDNCNKKINHNNISVYSALNPFLNSDLFIQKHISFNDEFIETEGDSVIGLNTIKKFRLDSGLLNTRRVKMLKEFHKALLVIKDNQIKENRNVINDDEMRVLKKFANRDQPYSLMFKILLVKHGIITTI